ncbi:STAS domain-containing protein [Paradesulfitobacterium aromaticivorans]
MSKGLHISTRTEERVQIIELAGELTQPDAILPEQILPPEAEIIAVVFNFTKVDYINSAGIALLIRLVRQAREKQTAVLAFGVSNHYQKIFTMVGLTNYLYLYPDEEMALAAAGLIK